LGQAKPTLLVQELLPELLPLVAAFAGAFVDWGVDEEAA